MKIIFLTFAILLGCPSYSLEHKRSKTINFEDELVEGINRKSLDSFNQISEIETQSLRHLYQKRSRFDDRNRMIFQEINLKQ